MVVNFAVTRRATNETELYIVSGMNGWHEYWLPASRELGLKIVPDLATGMYTMFPTDHIADLVDELVRLRPWMEARNLDLHVGFIDRILRVFADTKPDAYDYSFG